MVANKKGWMRILEATIAVMLISGVLVIIYTKQPSKEEDKNAYLTDLQKRILKDISTQSNLRNLVLNENITELEKEVERHLPSTIRYSLRICDLSKPCKLNETTFKETLSKDVLAEGTIISTNLIKYSPKKVMLFIWQDR